MPYLASYTFSTLATKVSRKLIDAGQTAISNSVVEEAIVDAVRYWKQKPFWFNQKTITLTMDISAATDGSMNSDPYVLGYGNSISIFPNAPVLPQDFLFEREKDGFTIHYSKLVYRFEKVTPAAYDDANIQGIGIPYIYCFRNGNYEFYFLPNIAYLLNVNYIKDYPDLANPGDTNDFILNADRLIMYEALSHLFGEDRQDDKQEAKFAAKADREYRMLKKRGNQNVATGSLTVQSILD